MVVSLWADIDYALTPFEMLYSQVLTNITGTKPDLSDCRILCSSSTRTHERAFEISKKSGFRPSDSYYNGRGRVWKEGEETWFASKVPVVGFHTFSSKITPTSSQATVMIINMSKMCNHLAVLCLSHVKRQFQSAYIMLREKSMRTFSENQTDQTALLILMTAVLKSLFIVEIPLFMLNFNRQLKIGPTSNKYKKFNRDNKGCDIIRFLYLDVSTRDFIWVVQGPTVDP